MSRKQPDPPKRPSRVHSNSFDYSLDFKKLISVNGRTYTGLDAVSKACF